jgi:hypothetical protein
MPHKLVSRLLFSARLLLAVTFAEAQVDSNNVVTSAVPFLRGNWEVQTRKMVFGHKFDEKVDDADNGSNSRFNLNLETHYWFSPKWAGGVEFNYDASSSKNGTEFKDNEFTAYAHLSYGINMKNNWGIYLRAGAGIGSGKQETIGGSNPQEIKYDVFSYKFEAGAPIHLNQQLFFVPYVNYKYVSLDYDDLEENDTRVQVGVNLVSYINCANKRFEAVPNIFTGRYSAGNSYAGVHGMTGYSFGSSEQTFAGNTLKDDVNRFNLKFDYTYYIFQNFAIGADVGFRSTVTKANDADFKTVRTSYTFAPKVHYNFPTGNWANDMFIFAGGGFGSQKNEVTFSGNTNTQKDNITQYSFGLGYNHFVSKTSLFTLSVGYENQTAKEDDSDQKFKESGLIYELGFRTRFVGVRGTY